MRIGILRTDTVRPELVEEFGSVAAYVWQWRPDGPELDLKTADRQPVPASTATSKALSADLKKRGWKFFGPTTAYAFMQAMGMVNDHIEGCAWFDVCADEQQKAEIPVPKDSSLDD